MLLWQFGSTKSSETQAPSNLEIHHLLLMTQDGWLVLQLSYLHSMK